MPNFHIMYLSALFCALPLFSRDTILELRGSYFLPTSSRFKDCYKGSVRYGPEFTMQVRDQSDWYLFASVEYFKQTGRKLSLCDAKKIRLVPLAVGVKYFIPLIEWLDFYTGFGFQPVHLKQKSKRALVTSKETAWGYGGIGKFGVYLHAPHHVMLNLFIDYSFVWTGKNCFYGHTVLPKRVDLSGALFGIGLGFNF